MRIAAQRPLAMASVLAVVHAGSTGCLGWVGEALPSNPGGGPVNVAGGDGDGSVPADADAAIPADGDAALPGDDVVVPVPDAASVVVARLPTAMSCGGVAAVSVTMRNDGTLTWTRDTHKLGAVGDGDPLHPGDPRIYLPDGTTVAPGESHLFSFVLNAPASPGTYVTDWQMVHEGVTWFGEVAQATVVVSCAPGAATGLRVHPANPHYFQDAATGAALQLAGHGSLVPSDRSYDYVAGAAGLAAEGTPYVRVWHLLPWAQGNAIWPWARSTEPGAYLGGNKYDLDSWNPEYWSRLRDALGRARAAGIIAEIHLFDRCGMSPAAWERWGNNPWASDNNTNELETPPAEGDGTPEFYEYGNRPRLRERQERYVEKMVAETIEFENVIYEIENEHWQSNDPDFGDHYARLVRARVALVAPGETRLVTYNSLQDDLEAFYTLASVDHVNVHFGNDAETDPGVLNAYLESHWHFDKPINIDEFGNGVTDPGVLRRMCWTIVASGGHFHIEDAQDSAQPFAVVRNVEAFKASTAWRFIDAAPDAGLAHGQRGFCMSHPGVETVCYFLQGGSVAIDLPAGTFVAGFWDPRQGGLSAAGTFVHGGGLRAFDTPSNDDWVIWVRAQ